jgi:hypothetical protein
LPQTFSASLVSQHKNPGTVPRRLKAGPAVGN